MPFISTFLIKILSRPLLTINIVKNKKVCNAVHHHQRVLHSHQDNAGIYGFFFFFLTKAFQSCGTFPKGIIKFKALLTVRCLFCNIPDYPNSLWLISAPFSLTLIKSGFIAYQVSCRARVLPPQERTLMFKLISLSLGSSVLISKGVQKYLFN